MVLGPRGERLFVANHIPLVRPFLDDENPTMYCEVSVVDTRRMEQIATVELPNGSQGLRGIALAPGGDCVVVTHVMSNFVIPTMEVAGGAMNRNALSLIRTESLDLLATVMLDDPRRGAANPWGVCFTKDGRNLVVSHAGTHEISVIRLAGFEGACGRAQRGGRVLRRRFAHLDAWHSPAHRPAGRGPQGGLRCRPHGLCGRLLLRQSGRD